LAASCMKPTQGCSGHDYFFAWTLRVGVGGPVGSGKTA
jgi:Ni2+-binding GTPase involved in maturation of urease and hydrogenase